MGSEIYKIFGLQLGQRITDALVTLPSWYSGRETQHTKTPLSRNQKGDKILINYYMWCLKSGENSLLIDTGMKDEDVTKRNLVNVFKVEDQLKKIDVDPTKVEIVIVTHLHDDHFSAYELYPKAKFYIQKRDIEFFGGVAARFAQVSLTSSDILDVYKLIRMNRVPVLDGDEQIVPGVRVVLVGGHTPGSQVVLVTTSKGEVVICGDAVDYYWNIEEGIIGGALSLNLADSLLALEKIERLTSSPELIIPGHDPLIMEKFPKLSEGIVEIA